MSYYYKYRKYKQLYIGGAEGLPEITPFGEFNVNHFVFDKDNNLNSLLQHPDVPELCGVIIDSNRLSIDGIGEWLEDVDGTPTRGTCNYKEYANKIWHTHPISSKFYPSPEDIIKVLKHSCIIDSYIFTPFGYWVITFEGVFDKWRDYHDILGKLANKYFYSRITPYRDYPKLIANNMMLKGNKYLKLQPAIGLYIQEVKTALSLENFNIQFNISEIPETTRDKDDPKLLICKSEL